MRILYFLLFGAACFAEDLVLVNETAFPEKSQSKMAVQWAASGKDVDEANQATLLKQKLHPDSYQILTRKGEIRLAIPKNAEYFRVLVWSKKKGQFDFLTNWVEVIPNKTYTLQTDHLIPAILMCGTGC